MRFDPFLVNEAIATLTCSLGMEWVIGEADTRQRGTPWPFRDHPVGQMIHEAGENQVAAALELAHYLKTVANSHAYPALVTRIKASVLSLKWHSHGSLSPECPPRRRST